MAFVGAAPGPTRLETQIETPIDVAILRGPGVDRPHVGARSFSEGEVKESSVWITREIFRTHAG